jgi:hypothetical protein
MSSIAWKPRFENGAPRALMKTNGNLASHSRCSRPRARNAGQRMRRRTALLDSTDVQNRVFEVDLLPT